MGSLHCRVDGDMAVNPVSYIQSGDMPTGVFVPAMIGASVQIVIEVKNTEDQSIHVSVSATEMTEALFGDLQFPGCVCPAKSTIQMTTTVNAANLRVFTGQVRRFDHRWKWRYMQNHVMSYDLVETTELIYVIPHLPSAPWAVNAQPYSPYEIKYIWTGLLDICCEACLKYETETGNIPNTDEEFVTAFVKELNENASFCYDKIYGASYYTVRGSAGFCVKLKKYLKDRQNLYNRLNCTDCATLIQITCRACGIGVSNAIMTGRQPGFPDDYFDTNEIIAIGDTNWIVPFNGGFSYHEITAFDGSRNQNTHIFDACLLVDGNDFPSKAAGAGNPPYVKQPLLPCDIIFAETGQDQVNAPQGQSFIPNPDCYRERLVKDGQLCNILGGVYDVTDIDLSVTLQWEVMMDSDSYLHIVKEKYGLTENPLPRLVTNEKIKKLEILSEESFKHQCRMTENYGRNQVFCLEQEQAEFRIEVTFAYHEKEAYAQLLYALSSISCPFVRRVEMGDVGYAIHETFYLFVKNNVLVRISNETEESTISVEPVARAICDSLERSERNSI